MSALEEPISEVQLEIAFLSCLTRNRPIGKEKHTVILNLQNEIYLRTRVRLDLADLWGRLEGMYDLQGIDNLNRSLLPPPFDHSADYEHSSSKSHDEPIAIALTATHQRNTSPAKDTSQLSVDWTSITGDTHSESPLTTASTFPTDSACTTSSEGGRSLSLLSVNTTHSGEGRKRAKSTTSGASGSTSTNTGTPVTINASITSAIIGTGSNGDGSAQVPKSGKKSTSWVSGRNRGRKSIDSMDGDGAQQLGVSVQPLNKKRKSP